MLIVKHELYQDASRWLIRQGEYGWTIKRMLYDTDRTAVARRLKCAMNAARISNSEMAEVCGVSIQGVGNWLRTGRVHPKRWPDISRAVGRSVQWITTGLEAEALNFAYRYQSLPSEAQQTIHKVADSLAKSASWDNKLGSSGPS